MPIDALSVLCAQLTRHLLAIAKFLLMTLMLLKVESTLRAHTPPMQLLDTRHDITSSFHHLSLHFLVDF